MDPFTKKELPTKPTLDTYQICWDPARFYQSASAMTFPIIPQFADMVQDLQQINLDSAEDEILAQAVDRLCDLYVAKAFFQLGWTPQKRYSELQENIDIYEIYWHITPNMLKPFKYFSKHLQVIPKDFKVDQADKEISDILKRSVIKAYPATQVVQKVGSNLAEILNGKSKLGNILNQNGKKLLDFYTENSRFKKAMKLQVEIFEKIISHEPSSNGRADRCVRILEIGAGSGSFFKQVVPLLFKQGISFEYHFTDISSNLVSQAKSKFDPELGTNFIFKTLDIETEPLGQGFPPEYFDVVVAIDVLHATKNLNESLLNIGVLTKAGGKIILGETEQPIKELDIIFGTSPEYWRFDDDIREDHCTISGNNWRHLLAQNGFNDESFSILCCRGQKCVVSAKKKISTGPTAKIATKYQDWVLLHWDKQEPADLKRFIGTSVGRRVKCFCVNQENVKSSMVDILTNLKESLEGIVFLLNGEVKDALENQFDVNRSVKVLLEPMLIITRFLKEEKWARLPRFHLVTEGGWSLYAENCSVQGTFSGAAWGFMRTARIELPGIISKSIDFATMATKRNVLVELTTELWLDDMETEVVYRNDTRYVRRLKKIEDDLLNETKCETNLLSMRIPDAEMENLPDDEVIVEIQNLSVQDARIGVDFAGVVARVGAGVTKWKRGDPVFGGYFGTSVKALLRVNENYLLRIPDRMSYAEAVTLPTAFFTAWHSLVNLAMLKKGQTVVIHDATTDMGLIAVQVATYIGAKLIGTVGTVGKKKHLQTIIAPENIFDSTTLAFKKRIIDGANRNGVDVVVNCLTKPGFKEATLEICRDGGHFVEIGKADIWSEQEFRNARPSVSYHIINLLKLEPKTVQGMLQNLGRLMEQGHIKPVPYLIFESSCIDNANRSLKEANHIGKVVLNQNRENNQEGSWRSLLFNERSTYLVTEWDDCMGFEVAKWMLTQGAKYLVLVGNISVSKRAEITTLESQHGAVIIYKKCDISDYSQCQQVFEEISSPSSGLPGVRGVHHCAGVVVDKPAENQDWEKFEAVLKPKLHGAWNLHRITKDLLLEHFVMYSSTTSVFGKKGQLCGTSADAFLESLAQFRKSLFLPAFCVNWCPGRESNGNRASPMATLERLMTYQHQTEGSIVTENLSFSELAQARSLYKDTLLEKCPSLK